jgi:hypothetical protein
MTETAYERLNNLEDIEFIAGTEYELNYTVTDEDGAIIDITGATVEYRVAFLGQPENSVINKTGTIVSAAAGTWTTKLLTADTEGLSGVFVGQPRVTDSSGSLFIAGQGNLIILPQNTV